MKIKLYNILKIVEADVEIGGITVIAGSNNTGKSTVGKSLVTAISAFASMDEYIETQRRGFIGDELDKLGNSLDLYCKKITGAVRKKTGRINNLIKKYIPLILDEDDDKEIKKNVIKFAEDVCDLYELSREDVEKEMASNEDVRSAYEEIIENLQLDDKEIGKRHVTDVFNDTFKNSIVNFNANEGRIELEENKLTDVLVFSRDTTMDICEKIEKDLIIKYQSLSVEGPDLLDRFDLYVEFDRGIAQKNRKQIFELLLKKGFNNYYYSNWRDEQDVPENIIPKLNLEKKSAEVWEKVQQIVKGHLEFDNDGIYFVENGREGRTPEANMSTGLKAMVLLEQIIDLGMLSEDTILVLDEPEIHLHPEWQVKYAEIVALLQKYVGLKIVITTHSPYFLKALLHFSMQYHVEERTNFYSTKEIDGGVIVEKVNGRIDTIFKQLTIPLFEIMEDEDFADL